MNARVLAQTKPSAKSVIPPVHSNLLQRKCACGSKLGPSSECEECRKQRESKTLHRTTGQPSSLTDHSSEVPPIVHEVLRSPGQPLDAATRAFMEPRLGHDFSSVRVHSDARAADSAQAVNACAYTIGSQIVFDRSRYAPETLEGRRLLVHELVHVVQQGASDNAGTQVDNTAPKTILPSKSPVYESLEVEADLAGAHFGDSYGGRKVIAGHGIGPTRHWGLTSIIQRKERSESARHQKAAQFRVERDHGRRGSYFIHFSEQKTREEVVEILFTSGSLPEGFQLEHEGGAMLGRDWKFRSLSGEIDVTSFTKFSAEFRKHFGVGMLEKTAEESAAHRAKYEAFMDSRPSYLGGQSVREAFQECRDHKVPAQVTAEGEKAALITRGLSAKPGPGCWGKRSGYFYYIGWQEGFGTELQVKSAPTSEQISKDWEWWLNQGFSLNDAELQELELQNWVLRQVVFSFASALSSAPGAVRRPQLPTSTAAKVGQLTGKAVETYAAWKAALGKEVTPGDLYLMALGGAIETAASSLGAIRRSFGGGPTAAGPTEITTEVQGKGPPAAAPKVLPKDVVPPEPRPAPPAKRAAVGTPEPVKPPKPTTQLEMEQPLVKSPPQQKQLTAGPPTPPRRQHQQLQPVGQRLEKSPTGTEGEERSLVKDTPGAQHQQLQQQQSKRQPTPGANVAEEDLARIRQLSEWEKKNKLTGDVQGLQERLRSNDPQTLNEAQAEFNEAKERITNGEKWHVEEYEDPRHQTPRQTRISTAEKSELQDSEWLKKRLPAEKDRREFMDWLKKGHKEGELGQELKPGEKGKEGHEHISPGSAEAENKVREWEQEKGRRK
jgi:hypothetical protein